VLKREDADAPLIVAGALAAEVPDGPEIAILEDLGYEFDPELKRVAPYDQIALLAGNAVNVTFGIGGAYNYYQTVFRDEDAGEYKVDVVRGQRSSRKFAWWIGNADKKFDWRKYYRLWRTYQMSDHLPKWVELRLD
jgi:hypothetical protein